MELCARVNVAYPIPSGLAGYDPPMPSRPHPNGPDYRPAYLWAVRWLRALHAPENTLHRLALDVLDRMRGRAGSVDPLAPLSRALGGVDAIARVALTAARLALNDGMTRIRPEHWRAAARAVGVPYGVPRTSAGCSCGWSAFATRHAAGNPTGRRTDATTCTTGTITTTSSRSRISTANWSVWTHHSPRSTTTHRRSIMSISNPYWTLSNLTCHPEDPSFTIVVQTHGHAQAFDVYPGGHDHVVDHVAERLGVEATAALERMLDEASVFVEQVSRHDHDWVEPPHEDGWTGDWEHN